MTITSEACNGEIVMTVSSGACNGKVAVLDLPRGEFGSNYDKDESCQWQIKVNDHQVGRYVIKQEGLRLDNHDISMLDFVK